MPITPARGLILVSGGEDPRRRPGAARGHPLAFGGDPGGHRTAGRLLGESVSDVNTALENPQASPYQPVPIAIGVSQSTMVYLSEHESLFPGVAVTFTAERTYPQGNTAAQVLGYTGDIDASELAGARKVRLHR